MASLIGIESTRAGARARSWVSWFVSASWWPDLRSIVDLNVFVDAPADVRLLRRIQPDMSERGRTAESVLTQSVATVRPMHERYVEPTRAYAELVGRSDGPLEACVEVVPAALPVVREGVRR